jgi:RNA polymerase sigma-70 factor (ECF subfamily)
MSSQPPQGEGPGTDPAKLLERWQSDGDVEALDELLQQEIKVLRAVIRRRAGTMLGASAGSMDLAQEAVMRLLRQEKAPNFDSRSGLHAYLWKTAFRLLIDRMRSGRRDVLRINANESTAFFADVPQASGGLSRVEEDDDAIALSLSMNLLTDEHRKVLELVYLQGLSIAEASERLGIEVGALRMRLTRARRSLAKRLSSWEQVIVQDNA